MAKRIRKEKARPLRKELRRLPIVPTYLAEELQEAMADMKSTFGLGIGSWEERDKFPRDFTDERHRAAKRRLQRVQQQICRVREEPLAGISQLQVMEVLHHFGDLVISDRQAELGRRTRVTGGFLPRDERRDELIAKEAIKRGYATSKNKKGILLALVERFDVSKSTVMRVLSRHGLTR